MKRLTKEDFISKARNIHGDKYSYSNVEYTNNRVKVIITCPVHGNFTQIPSDHLRGQGCLRCKNENTGNRCRKSLEEFTTKSREIHGDRYDYSKVIYKNNRTKVIILCKKHNIEFEQQPIKHLQGQGCPKCSLEKRGCKPKNYWTYEKCYEVAKRFERLSDFIKNEGVCYNTSLKNDYLKDFTWLKRCYDHDEDIVTARKHCIYKYEFPEYNTVYIGLTVDLTQRHRFHCAKGSVYNFCKDNNIEVPQPQIIEDNLTLEESKVREAFWIEYYKEQGCFLLNKASAGSVGTLCILRTGKETDLFIDKARKVHGNKYGYDNVHYINNRSKVTITCPKHGDFLQKPSNHLSGKGCKKCANEMNGCRSKDNTEVYITKAKMVHGNKYDYSETVYVHSKSKVTIICPIHGKYSQIARNHLQGSGCPKCSRIRKK